MMAGKSCSHIRAIKTVKHAKRGECEECHEDRRTMGPSADVSNVRRDALL